MGLRQASGNGGFKHGASGWGPDPAAPVVASPVVRRKMTKRVGPDGLQRSGEHEADSAVGEAPVTNRIGSTASRATVSEDSNFHRHPDRGGLALWAEGERGNPNE